MLILSRNVGQIIMINDDIRIKIVGIKGKHVKLMFDAPEDIRIYREEVYLKMHEDKKFIQSF